MTDQLTKLGTNVQFDYTTKPHVSMLETFDAPNNQQIIEFKCTEFTSLCPKTTMPDFGAVIIAYRPNAKCVETKSLKLYMMAYRMHSGFMEQNISDIYADLKTTLDTENLIVEGQFNARGGIPTVVRLGSIK